MVTSSIFRLSTQTISGSDWGTAVLYEICALDRQICTIGTIHNWWRQIWRYLHVTMLHCWGKFSNVLVHWSTMMIPAKHYETVSNLWKLCREYCGLFFHPIDFSANSAISGWIKSKMAAGRSVHHRSFHHGSIQHGRFITWTVHHTLNSTPDDSSQKLLYSAVIVFNISFSKLCDIWGMATIIRKMSVWLLSRKCPR